MERSYVIENARERERLRNLVNQISDEELSLNLYLEGWTVAVTLAHLAFWDERRLAMIRKWKQEGVTPSPIDQDIVNDAMVPLLLAIPPREAANLSVLTAEKIDRELAEISPDLIRDIESAGDQHALNRSIHRKIHLDDIEHCINREL